ncbi:MAG: hypothetical protein HY608_05855 [Planctomycetes bacterium]|nr:hypothetical protein [Planctomycetota bacterium]
MLPFSPFPHRYRRMTPEEKAWRRLLRELDAHPPSAWRVRGFVGVGFRNSLYKVYLRRGTARWWRISSSARQMRGVPPVARDVKSVEGSLEVLRGVTCTPWRPALVEILRLVQARLQEADVARLSHGEEVLG